MSAVRALRPVITLITAVIILSAAGFGQTRRHEITASYGVGSGDQMLDELADVLTVVITLGTFVKEGADYSGVPFLTYHYSANSRFGFGAAVGGYRSAGTLLLAGENAGTFTETSTILAAEIGYRWVMKQSFQLYSGAGAGVRLRQGTYVTSETETVNEVLPTFHINFIGLRFGRKVGVFFEAGAGYRGLLSGGLSAQF
jgi:hypothetical protein